MFNRPLKTELAQLRAEVAELRQLHAGFESQALSLTVDERGNVERVNERFCREMGYRAENVAGRPLDAFIPEYVKQLPCYRDLKNALSQGNQPSGMYRLLRANGQPQPYPWLVGVYFAGQFANNFLPTSVGGDAMRVVALGRRTGSYAQASASVFMERLTGFLAYLLDRYDAEGKAYLTIGIGCTGGRHRSVAVAAALADRLRAGGREVNVQHRDVEKEP